MVAVADKKEQRTVKAFDSDIALINEHAKSMGCTAAEVIHQMCEDLRKKAYLQDIGETFDLITGDAEKHAAFHQENTEWDVTLSDGLDDAT